MALAGFDPAVAAERMGHTDGGAMFLQRYRHLYGVREAVASFPPGGAFRKHLDGAWTDAAADAESPLKRSRRR
jgi:hypothetical protein